MIRFYTAVVVLLAFLIQTIQISALPPSVTHDETSVSLHRRTEPYFPDTPTSCPICAKDYASINSCAQACPVLANFSMIIFNPGAFIDVIMCACGDVFQSVFPQCVDCFIQTGQQDVLNAPNLPAVVDGMRKICGLQSTLLGNVSGANGYVTPTPTPSPISGTRDRGLSLRATFAYFGIALIVAYFGL